MLYSYSKVTVSLFNGTVIFSALKGDRTGVSPMISKKRFKKVALLMLYSYSNVREK